MRFICILQSIVNSLVNDSMSAPPAITISSYVQQINVSDSDSFRWTSRGLKGCAAIGLVSAEAEEIVLLLSQ